MGHGEQSHQSAVLQELQNLRLIRQTPGTHTHTHNSMFTQHLYASIIIYGQYVCIVHTTCKNTYSWGPGQRLLTLSLLPSCCLQPGRWGCSKFYVSHHCQLPSMSAITVSCHLSAITVSCHLCQPSLSAVVIVLT